MNLSWSTSVEWAECLEDMLSDECIAAFIQMNHEWRLAAERARRKEQILLVIDNTKNND